MSRNNTDWSTGFALFVAGVDVQTIAKQIGANEPAVRMQIKRNEWEKKRADLILLAEQNPGQQKLKEVPAPIKKLAEVIGEKRERFLTAQAESLVKASEIVAQRVEPGVTNSALSQLMATAESATRSAKTVFDLEKPAQINVGIVFNDLSQLEPLGFVADGVLIDAGAEPEVLDGYLSTNRGDGKELLD